MTDVGGSNSKTTMILPRSTNSPYFHTTCANIIPNGVQKMHFLKINKI
jgi:hypothetical protein